MEQCLIMCRSLTYAQAAMRTLERSGISVSLMKAPQSISAAGCSYGVRVPLRRLQECLELLRRNNRPIGKVYRFLQDGTLEEMSV